MQYRTQQVWRPWLYRAAGLGILLVALGLLVVGAFTVALIIAVGALVGLLAMGLSALTGRPVVRWHYRVERTDKPTGRVLEGEYQVLETHRRERQRPDSPWH